MEKKFGFMPLPTTADEDEEYGNKLESPSLHQVRHNVLKSSSWIRQAAVLLTVFISVLLGLTIITTISTPSSTKWSSCGNDPATARSRGCSFDLLSFAWQTPECYDGELLAEFASWNTKTGEGDWNFYSDDQYTQLVSQEVALHGERTPLFVKWDYHIVHCTFMWRQMHRAYERGWIDSHLSNYNHTLHCQKMILMDPEDMRPVMARIIYPECLHVAR